MRIFRWRFAFWLMGFGGLGLGAAAILLGAGARGAPVPSGTEPQNAVPVVTASATRQDVPEFVDGVGTVQAFNAVLIRSRVDGTLMEVPVKEGQEVKKGDLIAVIDPRPYQAALDAAMAKKAQDEATLANARRDLARYSSLAKQNFASQQQVDTQQSLVAQQTAALAGDQAAIESAQLNLSYCYIMSPIPGRVGLRQIDPGNLVHASDTTGIISIAQDHPITAVFTLPQGDLPQIAEALAQGSPRVLAFSSDGKHQLDAGALLAPNNQVDTSTGTIQLKAEFPNAKNTLWPGQFIDAHLQVGVARNAVTVPPPAIQHGPDGLYVYVVKQGNVAALQPVTVGYQTSDLAVVTSGLNGGETVVTEGALRLQPGTHVAASNRAAS
jgi:multidrug efflux system membrane fusion protein